MQILTTIGDFRSLRLKIRSAGSLGFVPTMGYLHDGHIELVRHARVVNEIVAVSIFMNPTQFGHDEDLLSYPRDVARDQALLEKAGCDLLFYPAVEEMYPPDGGDVHVLPGKLATVLEGASRPGHFRGVATVVAKLFNIVQPERAYFGQKDGQQLAVIRRIVRDLDFPVEIIAVPTVREPDGLAMSSRNAYLSPDERSAATVLYRALMRAQELHLKESKTLRCFVQRCSMSWPLSVSPRRTMFPSPTPIRSKNWIGSIPTQWCRSLCESDGLASSITSCSAHRPRGPGSRHRSHQVSRMALERGPGGPASRPGRVADSSEGAASRAEAILGQIASTALCSSSASSSTTRVVSASNSLVYSRSRTPMRPRE